ncbi:molybdate ABC transporter permease subunit [Caproicibacter sp.]|uniref:molybdate ABC transporter permease subunit n=1 Tax=Caproicibacter sp. TaxID=2814884 RepID=UPI00398A34F3
MDWSPFFISLKTAFLATAITFFLGLFAAWGLLRIKRFHGLIDGLFTLPMVLPPTVAGFFLILILGQNGPVGRALSSFGISILFSWPATVLSATVVSFPLMYRTALGAMEQVDQNLVYAARTLGMPEIGIFFRVIVPIARPGILAGGVLAFARALGEFGATMMIAGNIPGRTQTLSTAIYTAVQSGDRTTAYRWSAVVVALSFTMMILLNLHPKTRRTKKPQKTRGTVHAGSSHRKVVRRVSPECAVPGKK